MRTKFTILAIETSFDETAASVVINGCQVRSAIIASSMPLHVRYGGVIPEIAARAHTESILPTVEASLRQAFPNDEPRRAITEHIDAIAVTHGPGLVGSLLVGVNTAKALAATCNKPLIPVHHILGHVYSNFLASHEVRSTTQNNSRIIGHWSLGIGHSPIYPFPFLTLVASGGHTELILSRSHAEHQLISQTRDDAAGEAFDKAATLLHLGYPGGPAISAAGLRGDPHKYPLPRGLSKSDSLDFSFSGLKTALKQLITQLSMEGVDITKATPDLAASFEASIVDSLVTKTIAAAKLHQVKTIYLAGGVAANSALRQAFAEATGQEGFNFHTPAIEYCTDNASMIGAAGYASIQASSQRGNAIAAAAYAATLVKDDFPWYDVKVERNPILAL